MTPSRSLRRRLVSLAPGVVWCIAVAAIAMLASRMDRGTRLSGYAEHHVVEIAAVDARRVETLPVRLHQLVRAGQPVVYLDDAAEQHALEAAQLEIDELRATIEGLVCTDERRRDDAARRDARDERDLQLDRVEARLGRLDVVTSRELHRVRLAARRAELEVMRSLHDDGVEPLLEVRQKELEIAELEASLEAAAALLPAHDDAVAAAETRYHRHVDAVQQERACAVDLELLPLEIAVRRQERQLAEVAQRIHDLVLTSPIDGQVVAIDASPGGAATPGTMLVRIASTESSRIRLYLPDDDAFRLDVGQPVEIVAGGGSPRPGVVESIAGQIAELPPRFRNIASVPQWGRAVLVAGTTPDLRLIPGEPVEIWLSRARQATRPSSPGGPAAAGGDSVAARTSPFPSQRADSLAARVAP